MTASSSRPSASALSAAASTSSSSSTRAPTPSLSLGASTAPTSAACTPALSHAGSLASLRSAAFSTHAPPARTRTVAVLGASYGGISATLALAKTLPPGWRIVLVDRNSHANHLYAFPRFAVVPGHEHKAFVPLTGVFHPPEAPAPPPEGPLHRLLHGTVTRLDSHSITLAPPPGPIITAVDAAGETQDVAGPSCVPFDYAIYALGSRLPAPIDLWDQHAAAHLDDKPRKHAKRGTKAEGVDWFQRAQRRIAAARSVLVVGGGALGIQFASDIAATHPEKRVTLLHSRDRLLPRFDPELSAEVISALIDLGVHVILKERLDLESVARAAPDGEAPLADLPERTVHTISGREIRAELVLLCTGQSPNTDILRELVPDAIIGDGPDRGLVRVKRTMQVAVPAPAWLDSPADDDDDGGAGVAGPSAARRADGARVDAPSSVGAADPILASTAPAAVGTADPTLADTSSADADAAPPASPAEDAVAEAATIADAAAEADEVEAAPEPEPADDFLAPLPHMFCVGDAADAFGAIKAGHTAFWQAAVAAANIAKLARADDARARLDELAASPDPSASATDNEAGVEEDGEEAARLQADVDAAAQLERYAPGAPAIKVSLGLDRAAYQVNGEVGTKDDCPVDLDVRAIWQFWGAPVEHDDDMHA